MPTIQILGIGCRKTKALKANLAAALEYLSLDIEVEEIAGVDEIVSYGVSSTPALLIDGRVRFQGVVPGVAELVSVLKKYARIAEYA